MGGGVRGVVGGVVGGVVVHQSLITFKFSHKSCILEKFLHGITHYVESK